MSSEALRANGPSVFLTDEVSHPDLSDPGRNALEIATRCRDEKIATVLYQLGPGNARHAAGAFLVKDALASISPGTTFGTWDQMGATTNARAIRRETVELYRSKAHVFNAESRAEEQALTDAELDEYLSRGFTVGLAFTAAAFKEAGDATLPDDEKIARWQNRTTRWRNRPAIVPMPEANEAEDKGLRGKGYGEVLFLCHQLGWPSGAGCVPILYLTDIGAEGYRASSYQAPWSWWSLWRFGGASPADWQTMRPWPRGSVPPPDPIVPKMGVMAGHANTRYGVQAVRNQIAPQKLGDASSLVSQDRLALGAISGVHTAAKGAEIAQLLDRLGYPKV